ncbi:MAG: glycine zipper 2TM domain-containing protein [Gammaproteobacteria bacterium]|nr:glycine zipper 2TM domain-containing protein [Gammaproteobacteria bacterium]
MNTSATRFAAILFGVLASCNVLADDDNDRHGHHRHHHHDYVRSEIIYAPVIYVEPMYQVVRRARPSRECWSSTESYQRGSDGAGGLVLGGVLGGVIGHNIAHGRDRDVAVLAGTLLGATIGHDLDHSSYGAPVTRTHCETSYEDDEVEQVVGYRVQYRYSGRIYETQTDRHPGARVRVTVSIED